MNGAASSPLGASRDEFAPRVSIFGKSLEPPSERPIRNPDFPETSPPSAGGRQKGCDRP